MVKIWRSIAIQIFLLGLMLSPAGSMAADFEIFWDSNCGADIDLQGYYIYYKENASVIDDPSGAVDVYVALTDTDFDKDNPSLLIPDLLDDERYCFAVTAWYGDEESGMSNEVCGINGTYASDPDPNLDPVADAGGPYEVTDSDDSGSQAVTLDGSASSDSDGTITSYRWFENGTPIGSGVKPTLSFAVGTHTVTLTVTDNDNATHSNDTTVTVNPATNEVPVADAGGPYEVTDNDDSGSQAVTLDGSASWDSDGTLTSYQWFENGTPIGTGVSPTLSFTVGTHTVTLTVTDNDNATHSNDTTVTVNPANNEPPVADAGGPYEVADSDDSGSQAVTLDGSASSDSDGTLTSYQWFEEGTQIGTGVKPTLSFAVGSHTVTLMVTDNDNATHFNDTTVTVNPANNKLPVADAGGPYKVTDSDDSGSQAVTLDGSASSDSDGTITSYRWFENGTPIGSGVKPTLTFSVGRHTVTLTVTDNDNATHSDDTTVTVNPANNELPVADAGGPYGATDSDDSGSQAVTLDGSASSDSDGTITSYQWFEEGTQIGTGVKPTLSFAVGTHTVTLTVTDNDNATHSNDTTVIVNPAPSEIPQPDPEPQPTPGSNPTPDHGLGPGVTNVTGDGSTGGCFIAHLK